MGLPYFMEEPKSTERRLSLKRKTQHMKRYITIILYAMFGSILSPLHSQTINSFSSDTLKFPGEFRSFMEKALNEQEMTVLDDYLTKWSSFEVNNEYRSGEVTFLNLLLKKSGRPKPHFIDYLNARQAFSLSTTGNESYENWKKGMRTLLENKKVSLRIIDQVLTNSYLLLTKNLLNSSSAVSWKATSGQYRILYDSTMKVVFDKTDLICYSQRDSAMILGTSGTYFLTSLRWQGLHGKVTWERAGYAPDKVYAVLNKYTIDMARTEYKADSTLFYHNDYFKEPLLGILTDKAKFVGNPEQATHPQFDTYQTRIYIQDFYDNIDYDGGLSMQGARLNGFGDQREKSKIFVYREDSLILKAASSFFVFRPEEVNSRRTEATIYIGKDSIYHPQIFFNFNVPNRELSLLQTEDAMSKSPYFNSLQKIDMTVSRLSWKIDEPVIRFAMARGAAMGTANFQSENYYNASFFNWLQGMDEVNPLFLIKKFSQWYYSDEFPAKELANWLTMPVDHVQQLLIRLSSYGFVYYNSETDEAMIKAKLNQYLDASTGTIDYDVMNLISQVDAPWENASLDLKTHDLSINGVPEIHLSDSQNVTIYPDKSQIIMKANRNFLFDGKVNAGLFSFYGRKFIFDYDSFMVRMPWIDSLQLRFVGETTDAYGNPSVLKVHNIIEDAHGQLEIDNPYNKSGLRSIAEYPVFTSQRESYVYYTPGGVKDTVPVGKRDYMFKLDPFKIYNLDNLTREEVEFNGEFESRNVLPPFAQTLKIKSDMSLGFDHDVPAEGVPIYGGKAFFFNKLQMSNQGLKGSGKLTYLTSTTFSDEFRFYPDSMVTDANTFTVHEQQQGVSYPEVESADVSISWFPQENKWIALQRKDPFRIFGGKVTLGGSLNLTSKGMLATGRTDLLSSTLQSGLFRFSASSYTADTSELRMRNPGRTGFSFVAPNVRSNIDLSTMKGTFKSNDPYVRVDYPENQYVSYIERFAWDINENDLVLSQAGKLSVAATAALGQPAAQDKLAMISRFISTHPKQDSLSFSSPTARYDIDNQIIRAEQVQQIEVADAIIYPADGLINIEKAAHMVPLKEARIEVIHPATKHSFFKASVNITGKYAYFGSGNYTYVDENRKEEVIFFNDIAVDSMKTVASGLIQPADSFFLNPYFSFIGKANLMAGKPLLTFSGGARIMHDCQGLARNYLAFTAEIDPMKVLIPVSSEPKATNNTKIFVSDYITNDSTHIYPAFLSARRNYSDIPITTANGYLYYDKTSGEYRITSLNKLDNPSLPDNYMSLNRNYCRVFGEGKLTLGVDLGQLKLVAAGNITQDMEKNETLLNVTLGLNFFFSQDALNIMAAEIKSLSALPGVEMNNPDIRKSFTVLAGPEKVGRLYDEINVYGSYMQIPDELNKTILITNVKLRWNQPTNSYRSVGKIAIGIIGGTPVNVLVDGYLEIQKKRSGDLLDMYLELDKNTHYFFGYTRGVMMSIASNEMFRKALTDLKVNQRELNVKSGETPYTYMIAVDQRMEMFLRRIRRDNPQEGEGK